MAVSAFFAVESWRTSGWKLFNPHYPQAVSPVLVCELCGSTGESDSFQVVVRWTTERLEMPDV